MTSSNQKDSKPGPRRTGKKLVLNQDERARLILQSLPELTSPDGSLFDLFEARAFSCYSGIAKPQEADDPKSQKVLRIIPPDKLWPTADDHLVPPLGEAAHDQLRALIMGEYYPCLGARAAFAKGTYRFGFYKHLGHLSSAAAMGHDLRRFASEYEKIGDFTTFIAVFKHPQITSEDEFESLLWKHLQILHNHDEKEWDPHYSPDPGSERFAFSFHGKAFFVVGMHPGSSRFSRRFSFTTLVFNPESQILKLIDAGLLAKFSSTVRERDTLFQGSINPSLPEAVDTTGGEAQVYSGKAHPASEGWKCPFRPRPEVLEKHKKVDNKGS